MDELSVRSACENDFKQVLELSKGMYNNDDYLPLKFHEWLEDKNYLIFVILYGDKIAGLMVVNFVDGDKTAVYRAVRIHSDFRGRGISSKLISTVTKHLLSHYPTTVMLRGTTVSGEGGPTTLVHKLQSKLLLELATVTCKVIKGSSMIDTLQNIKSIKLYHCLRTEVLKYANSQLFSADLFKSNIHVIDWMPYEIIECNSKVLFHEGDCMFIEINISGEQTQKSTIQSFSHGRLLKEVSSQFWTVTIYAPSPTLLRSHIIQQLVTAIGTIEGEFVFVVFIDTEMFSHAKELLHGELQLKRVDHFPGLNLWEKDLSSSCYLY